METNVELLGSRKAAQVEADPLSGLRAVRMLA
jgi:hypothetical protein